MAAAPALIILFLFPIALERGLDWQDLAFRSASIPPDSRVKCFRQIELNMDRLVAMRRRAVFELEASDVGDIERAGMRDFQSSEKAPPSALTLSHAFCTMWCLRGRGRAAPQIRPPERPECKVGIKVGIKVSLQDSARSAFAVVRNPSKSGEFGVLAMPAS
jgi:hypothetical protein